MSMQNTKAWMLRQDGTPFEVKVHLYVMDDADLSSEAECAAFMLSAGTKDVLLANEVLDAYMALGIEDKVPYDGGEEDISKAIKAYLSHLPYRFAYPLTIEKMLTIHNSCRNYTDTGSLYDYIDSLDREELSNKIKQAINQEFCRVRYGGKYDFNAWDSSTIWFRVSSAGYNWANTIYIFAAEVARKYRVNYISICRDYESDNGDDMSRPEYFYKAKDGTPYHEMPMEDYLAEEHEHNPVFSNRQITGGVVAYIKAKIAAGESFYNIENELKNEYGIDMPYFMHDKLLRSEISSSCIAESDYFETLHKRTQQKIEQSIDEILDRCPEISDIEDVRIDSAENSKGNPVGSILSFKLKSSKPKLNIWFDIKFNKNLNQQTAGSIVRKFCHEFEDYLKFADVK